MSTRRRASALLPVRAAKPKTNRILNTSRPFAPSEPRIRVLLLEINILRGACTDPTLNLIIPFNKFIFLRHNETLYELAIFPELMHFLVSK